MKRKVNYMGGYSSILLDVQKKKIYHYEEDTLAVHEEYGGEFYYESRSGYTGEGYITSPTPLFCSSYRVDCREVNFEKPLLDNGGVELQIFAPIKGHEKAWDFYPFVIRIVVDYNHNNNTLIFVNYINLFELLKELLIPTNDSCSLKQYVQKWIKNQKTKEITYEVVEPYWLRRKKITINVINHKLGIGLNYLQFLDLRKYRIKEPENTYRMQDILDIAKYKGYYFLVDNNNLPIEYYSKDPVLSNKEVKEICQIKGWEYQKRRNINILIQPKKDEVKIVAYQNIDKIYRYYQLDAESIYGVYVLEYEAVFPLIVYNCHPDNCIRQVIKGLKNKMKQDIKYELEKRKTIKDLLEFINNNPNKIVTIEDSITAGNCRFGTENFRDEYFPGREEVTLKDLQPYINRYDVQRVVRYIMTK